jgi:hypothetical protein
LKNNIKHNKIRYTTMAISCLDTRYLDDVKPLHRPKRKMRIIYNIYEVIDKFDILEEYKNKLKTLTPQIILVISKFNLIII